MSGTESFAGVLNRASLTNIASLLTPRTLPVGGHTAAANLLTTPQENGYIHLSGVPPRGGTSLATVRASSQRPSTWLRC